MIHNISITQVKLPGLGKPLQRKLHHESRFEKAGILIIWTEDTFQPDRHKIVPIINPGIRLRKYYKNNIKTTKHEKSNIRPELIEYIDNTSGECRSKITPGDITTIKGHNLRHDPENNEDGIYYIAENGSEIKVEVIARNNPSILLYKTPESLAPGLYQIEVRTKRGQILRTGRFNKVLKVE